jgi:uncharacterized protein GlcG (DUF336 family)
MKQQLKRNSGRVLFAAVVAGVSLSGAAVAQDSGGRCAGLPSHDDLQAALAAAVMTETSGLNNQMWATVVNRDGVVCAVAFSGSNRAAQWPGSRVISAQKANTGNAFCLDSSSSSNGSGQPAGLALSTANLYTGAQPGSSVYAIEISNPVDTGVAYGGNPGNYGAKNDPMVGNRIGGVNVFGGGLGLYASGHVVVGGVGVSGDTACADHDIAWRVRNNLGLDHLGAFGSTPAVGGVSGDATHPDNIIYDITPNPNGGTGISAGGFGHPTCVNTANPAALPPVRP